MPTNTFTISLVGHPDLCVICPQRSHTYAYACQCSGPSVCRYRTSLFPSIDRLTHKDNSSQWGLTAQSTSLDHQLPGCHVNISTERYVCMVSMPLDRC